MASRDKSGEISFRFYTCIYEMLIATRIMIVMHNEDVQYMIEH